MKKRLCVLLNVLFSLVDNSKSQHMIINRKVNQSNQCDPNNALVEQFFNIMFTEFHQTPPVCVCIQMCVENPTYCYPNGCLRNSNSVRPKNNTANAVNRIQYDARNPAKSVMFLVDNNKDLTEHIIFEEPKIHPVTEGREIPTSNDLKFSPNPFRELVFKYRKVPKLQMRYNLREKVKNSKTDKIKTDKLDLSKTRWSMNKILNAKQLLSRIGHYRKDDDSRRTFFTSMFPDFESLSMKKRYITKREDNSDLNVDAFYIYKTDVANFSVENLIDELIINTLHNDKDNMKFNKKNKLNETVTVITTTEISTDEITDEIGIETTVTDRIEEMTTFDTILINSTYIDNNINNQTSYSNLLENTNTYLDKIVTMSEEIEKNNNVTIEFVKRVTGQGTLDKKTIVNISVNDLNADINTKMSNEINVPRVTTEFNNNEIFINIAERWTVPVLMTKLNQKNRQRLRRKLIRKKN